MGTKAISLKLPTNYTEEQLKERIAKQLNIRDFSFHTESKSLDARNKKSIFWLVKVLVSSSKIKGDESPEQDVLQIPFKKRNRKIVVVGSGPAGFLMPLFCKKPVLMLR